MSGASFWDRDGFGVDLVPNHVVLSAEHNAVARLSYTEAVTRHEWQGITAR